MRRRCERYLLGTVSGWACLIESQLRQGDRVSSGTEQAQEASRTHGGLRLRRGQATEAPTAAASELPDRRRSGEKGSKTVTESSVVKTGKVERWAEDRTLSLAER